MVQPFSHTHTAANKNNNFKLAGVKSERNTTAGTNPIKLYGPNKVLLQFLQYFDSRFYNKYIDNLASAVNLINVLCS